MSQQHISVSEVENIVDSTIVAQPPDHTHILELPSGVVPEETPNNVAQKPDREVSQTERKNQEQSLSLNDIALVEAQAQSEQKQDAEVSQEIQQEQCHLLISIGQAVSFTLEGEQTKQRVKVPMSTSYISVMTYLALQQKEDLRNHKAIAKALYGDEKKTGLFNKHTSRIRELIRERVPEKFIYTPPVEKALDAKPFDPFKQEFIGRDDSRWQLSSFCHVTGTKTLTNLYRKIKAGKPLMSEEWRKGVHQLRKIYSSCYLDRSSNEEEYSGGYLSKYLREDTFKNWALVLFNDYRRQYVYVLERCAENEQKFAKLKQNDKGIKIAAELYKECAYAATCEPLDQGLGENALRKCIDMYMLIDDEDAARDVCDIYAKRVKKIMLVWEPGRKTKEHLERHGLLID